MVVGSWATPGMWLPLFLVIGIGFGLLVAALASQPAVVSVYERRKTVVFIGLVTAASVALGLVILLLAS